MLYMKYKMRKERSSLSERHNISLQFQKISAWSWSSSHQDRTTYYFYLHTHKQLSSIHEYVCENPFSSLLTSFSSLHTLCREKPTPEVQDPLHNFASQSTHVLGIQWLERVLSDRTQEESFCCQCFRELLIIQATTEIVPANGLILSTNYMFRAQCCKSR